MRSTTSTPTRGASRVLVAARPSEAAVSVEASESSQREGRLEPSFCSLKEAGRSADESMPPKNEKCTNPNGAKPFFDQAQKKVSAQLNLQ